MDQIIAKFIRHLEAKERSQETKNAYKINLEHFNKFLSDNELSILSVTKDQIAMYISLLQKNGFKNSSINQRITTLRNLFSYIEKRNKITNPLIETQYFKKVETTVELTIHDVRKIISFLETSESFDLTTRLICLFMIYFELKGSEICKIKLSDMHKENNSIYVNIKKERIDLAREHPALFSLFVTYLNGREKMKKKYNEIFLNRNNKPLSKLNIVYIANKIAGHFDLKDRSILILSKAKGILNKSRLINNRYEVIKNTKSSFLEDVYEVHDIDCNNNIKLLSLYKTDEKTIANFKKIQINFNLLTQIHHRNLLKVFDLDLTTVDEEQKILITREHFRFNYLSCYVGKMSCEEFLELAYGLCSGLKAIQRNGLTLNLINPENVIVINSNGKLIPKFFEWGIDFSAQRENEANIKYIAPETIAFNQRDKKSEIYSLGIMLNYLVENNSPIKNELAQALKEIILGMVEQEPEKRVWDIQSCIDGFNPFLSAYVKEENIEISTLNIDISTELSLLRMKLDVILDWQKETAPEYLLVVGDRGSGKTFLLDKLEDMCLINNIAIYRIDCGRDATADSLVELFQKKTDKSDIDISARKISLFESTSQIMNRDKASVFAIDNFHKASQEFCEFLFFIIKKFHISKKKVLFAITYEKEDVDEEFLNSLSQLDGINSSLTVISINPLSREEISNVLYSNFKRDISDEVLDYVFLNSKGVRGKVLNIVNFILQNNYLIINPKKKIDFSLSFYQVDDEYSLVEKNNLSIAVIKIISCADKPISKEILIKILKELGLEVSKLPQSLKTLLQRDVIKYSNTDKDLQIANKYILTCYYNKIDDPEKKKIHNHLGEQIKKTRSELSHEDFNEIANHFLRAENREESFYYFTKLAETALDNGLLNDALLYYNKLTPMAESFNDKDKIDFYTNRIKIFLDLNDLKQASSEIDILTKLIINPQNSILLQYLISRIHLKSGSIKSALKVLDNALLNPHINTMDELYPELLILKTSSLLWLARYNAILQDKESFLNFKFGEKNFAYKIRLMNLVALAYYYIGEFDNALTMLKEALLYSKNTKSKSINLRVLNNLGLVSYQMCLFKESRAYYEEALKISDDLDDLINKANILNNLGGVEHMIGNFNSALSFFLQAEEIYNKFEGIAGYENVLFSKALLFSHIGYFDKTEEILKSADQIALRRENHLVTTYSLALLGNMERVRGNFEDSINMNNQAIALFKNNNLLKELCQTHLSNSETYLEMENIDKAEKELNMAREIKKVNHFPDISLRIILQEISFLLRVEPIQYAEVNNKFNIIHSNEIISNDWELKLKYLRLRAIYCKMLGNHDELSDTLSHFKEEMKRIIGSDSQEDIKTFFEKSEFGKFINSFEMKYAKKSELERILEINLEITENLNLDLLLSKILTSIILLSNSESVFIILIDQNLKLNVRDGRDNRGNILKRKIADFREDLIRNVIENKKPIIEVIDNESSLHPEGNWSNGRKIISIPLLVRREPIGILYIENDGKGGLLAKINMKLLTLLASQAAIAIENARLYKLVLDSKKTLEYENKNIQSELHRRSFYLDHYERELKHTYGEIIGKSEKINNILKILDNIVDSEISVLIYGESGTGKELIARAVHFNGQRKNKPFIAENCAAFTETLLESELFGHGRGAFTDAHKDKRGIFEMANGGTVFLDEVGEMSLNMQKKLLRLLERGEVRRIGDEKIIKVDVRLISASNKNIKELIKRELFREDLYYRLNGITIALPPLRERKEDIPYLVKNFLKRHAERNGEKFYIDEGVLGALENYDWPGNIRELKNEVDRLIALSDGNRIGIELLEDDSRFK